MKIQHFKFDDWYDMTILLLLSTGGLPYREPLLSGNIASKSSNSFPLVLFADTW
jgi:hypothetical protein